MSTPTIVGLAALLFTAGLMPGQEVPGPPDTRTAKARALIAALEKGDYAAAGKDYDEAMKKAAGPDVLEKLWKSLVAQGGPFRSQGAAKDVKLGKYTGIIVRCEFEKMPMGLRVVFDDQARVSGLQVVPATDYLAPAYVKRDAFKESEVQVGTGEWALPGTLSLPQAAEPVPGVVLVHGSGPQDRDETIGGHKVFRDLAWGLASKGIAVLRYDKRTLAHRTRMAALKDTISLKEEVLEDAQAAVQLLRKTQGVDPRRVFILGHSLGSMAAPTLAAQDPALAGTILLAAPTRSLVDSIIDQTSYLLAENKDMPEEGRAILEKALANARRVKEKGLADDAKPEDLPLGMTARYLRSVDDLQPAKVAASLKCPVLVLQGERDYQVPMADFQVWQQALKSMKGATLRSYKGLNHLFVAGEGKSLPAEYGKEGHVAPQVIEDIAAWVKDAGAK